ncbi:MAG: S26 family signal peptidase [Sphingorhabdus sp.]|uniref:S26 family signal peptidase n=1 Tax=Sphingorhabdus sp. TaxID=1902408 RepID=UPI003CBC9801
MDRATEPNHHRRRYAAIAMLVAVLAGTQAIAAWRDSHMFLVNTSTSLGHWAFFVDRGRQPKSGEIAFFRAPQSPIVTRHFGEPVPPFGKIVYGVGGDAVTRHGDVIRINGAPIVKLKRFTKKGEALVPGPVGTIPNGCFFMATPHKDGLDSRYADIGFVCARQILGTARPIL